MMHFSNLHTHTTFSDGKNTPEEVVRAAIIKQMCAIGFSDHSYTPCDESYCIPAAAIPAYCGEIRRLQEIYRNEIDVLLGLELDACSECHRTAYDYLIASVHYLCIGGACYPVDHSLRQQTDCINRAFHGDKVRMAKRYFSDVYAHVAATHPDIVGHFDVITKFGLFDDAMTDYRETAKKAVREVLQICPIIELNTGAISRGVRAVPYPEDYLLYEILNAGGKITLSADAHVAETIDSGFSEAIMRLRRIGYEKIYFLMRDGWHEQKI